MSTIRQILIPLFRVFEGLSQVLTIQVKIGLYVNKIESSAIPVSTPNTRLVFTTHFSSTESKLWKTKSNLKFKGNENLQIKISIPTKFRKSFVNVEMISSVFAMSTQIFIENTNSITRIGNYSSTWFFDWVHIFICECKIKRNTRFSFELYVKSHWN